MLSSSRFYSAFSGSYATYAESRRPYLESVDRFILREVKSATNMLDVGTGDGQRAVRLSQKLNTQRLDLLDSSPGMCQLAQTHNSVSVKGEVYCMDICDPTLTERYDLVTCLWNVLGHIHPHSKRVKALASMARLIKPGGSLIFDVNNRYNYAHYGFVAVRNCIRESFYTRKTDGDFSLSILMDGKPSTTMVHLFCPKEVRSLLKAAGLVDAKLAYIDYASGERVSQWWKGQIICKVSL